MAGVALSILKSASQQLGSLLVEEAKFLYDVSDKMEKLRLDLEWMQCFLQDADKKQNDSKLIRLWISQIGNFAYEAEDIIEKYLVRVGHHRETGIWNTVKWASCALGDAKELHEIGSNIDALSLRMSELGSRLQICGVEAIARDNKYLTSARLADPRRTNSCISEKNIIVGLDEEAHIIAHQLINTDRNVVVISGMGGLGKTTLAKKVCNDQTVQGHFDNRVWIFVSQEFDVLEIFKEILRKLWDDNVEKRKSIYKLGDEEFPEKIRESLQEKSYLVVLDDVWNDSSWNYLQPALSLPSRSASKLLLTTRMHELQRHVDVNGYLHKLEHLSPENSWNLLKAIVSQGQYDIDFEMEKVGQMMLKQTRYLPIATVTIGGILKSKSTIDEWKTIHKNIHSILTITNDDGMRINEVLEMSYHDLPLFLRPCLLYLASFPEDYEISAKKLYHLWEAEGLVSPEANVNVTRFQKVVNFRDIAEFCLDELVSRCMIGVEQRSCRGKIKTCRIHDLIRDMCIQKAREEGFFSVISSIEKFGEEPSAGMTNTRLYRWAVYINNSDERPSTALRKAIQNAKHLRSVLYFPLSRKDEAKRQLENAFREWLRIQKNFGQYQNISIADPLVDHLLKLWTENCYLLRVLDLEGAILPKLPKQIKNLVHLKYLSLRNAYVNHELSKSIAKLQCLQTLDLRIQSYYKEIPNLFWKLKRLRHLYLPKRYLVRKSLRLHTLSHLETLKNLDLSTCQVEDLFELKSLMRLGFKSIFEWRQMTLLLSSSNVALGHLTEPIHIYIHDSRLLDEESVDQLIQLQGYKRSVGSLHIDGKINLQAVQNALWNLTKITFEGSEFETDPMPVLERLPKLSKLTLDRESFVGNKMTCSSTWFRELIQLTLMGLEYLKEWRVEEGAMWKLQCLVIKDCPQLKQLLGKLPDTVHI